MLLLIYMCNEQETFNKKIKMEASQINLKNIGIKIRYVLLGNVLFKGLYIIDMFFFFFFFFSFLYNFIS